MSILDSTDIYGLSPIDPSNISLPKQQAMIPGLSIYQKALEFVSASMNKPSHSETKRDIQLFALRCAVNPKLPSEVKNILDQVFKFSLNLHKKESRIFAQRHVVIESPSGSSLMRMKDIAELLFDAMLAGESPLYIDETIERDVLKILDWRIANCHEYSYLVYALLMECKVDASESLPMEIIRIENSYDPVTHERFDHVFVLAGRDPESDINAPSSWGENATLIDPWWEKQGSLESYQATLEVHAGRMQVLHSGKIGQGHSPSWPDLFPHGDLFDYTPKEPHLESIRWAFDKKEDILQFAEETLQKPDAFQTGLELLKPWLLNQKKIAIPVSLKIQFFCKILPLFPSLSQEGFGFDKPSQFTQNDFWELWRDPEIQDWYSSTHQAFDLFKIAFQGKSHLICGELLAKNRELKDLLTKNAFYLSENSFNFFPHQAALQKLNLITV